MSASIEAASMLQINFWVETHFRVTLLVSFESYKQLTGVISRTLADTQCRWALKPLLQFEESYLFN